MGQLKNLDIQSTIKGEIESKIQRLIDERFSVSKTSLMHESEQHENLFSAE